MKSNLSFIVKPLNGKRYDDTRKIGDVEVNISTSIEDAKVVQRLGTVVSTPIGYKGDIRVGDTVVVHHNVFRLYYDVRGDEKSTASHFYDNLFFVEENRIYLYKGSGEWQCNGNYCFVKPVDNDNDLDPSSLKEFWGELKYESSILSVDGVSPGDTVSFQPECEYEFEIEGETLYRMYTYNICLTK
jgi:hypothetical protein